MTAAIALAALLIVVAGAAIGATSVGGVLVLPALTGIVGIDVKRAVAATSFAFLATGLITMIDLQRSRVARINRDAAASASVAAPWRDLRVDAPLHIAALAGAALGAAAVHATPAGAVRLWIAVLAIVSGVHALVAAAGGEPRRSWPRPAALAAIGVGVGFGSGLSGTGGPILLLPVLLLLGQPLPRSVEAALVLQVPIALASTLTHAFAGRLDWQLGLAVGAGLAGGAWLGRRLSTRVDPRGLKRATGAVLVATGIAYAFA